MGTTDSTRSLSRLRPPRRWKGRGRGSLPEWIWFALGLAALPAMVAAFVFIPNYLYIQFRMSPFLGLEDRALQIDSQLGRQWVDQSPPPLPGKGNEQAVAHYLERHPWFQAGQHLATGQIWIREGQALVPAPQGHPYAPWFKAAREVDENIFFPPAALDPLEGQRPCAILVGQRWALLKLWIPGSPEADQGIRMTGGLGPGMKLGFQKPGDHLGSKLEAWAARSEFELDSARTFQQHAHIQITSPNFMRRSATFVLAAAEADQRRIIRMSGLILWGARALVVALCVGLLFLFKRKHRQRLELRLESERMAATAHALRTPLAILKFRCDLLRLGQLDDQVSREQLLRIGTEVDQITDFLSASLHSFRRNPAPEPLACLDGAWFTTLAEEYRQFFLLEFRELQAEIPEVTVVAAEMPLRTSLQVLLDNALVHGKGTVTLRIEPSKTSARLTIHDQGPALAPDLLESLGRARRQSPLEASQTQGLGLGLFLLVQQALVEGWGLTFDTAEGMGLIVHLDLPTGEGARA